MTPIGKPSQEVLMPDSERTARRLPVFSLFVGAMATVVVSSPPAHADDDLFTPSQPSIVVGGTVHPSTSIVVDPQTPAGTTAPPIDASKPIGVDPGVLPPKPQALYCCATDATGSVTPVWLPSANPPVVQRDRRRIDDTRTAFLDNHGRYWLITHLDSGIAGTNYQPNIEEMSGGDDLVLEQIGGWPAMPRGLNDLFDGAHKPR
jgi:hypothetical protein